MDIAMKDVGLLPARLSLGATMLHHGWSKITAEGAAQHGGFFEQLGFKPGARWARLTGAAEVAAGASSILGFATRLGALAILVTQGVAIAKVHAPKGFSAMSGGWEFNALLCATALGLLVAGPGAISVHELLERGVEDRRGRWLPVGPRWLLSPWRRSTSRAVRLLR
jgi:putative oxidoreductase